MAEIEPAGDEETEAAAAFTAAPDGGFIFARKPSRIVIVSNGRSGVALWWVGAGAWSEIEEGGLSDAGDLGLDDAPSGITIWEGDYRATQGFCGDFGGGVGGDRRRPLPLGSEGLARREGCARRRACDGPPHRWRRAMTWTKKLEGVKLPEGVEVRILRDDQTCFSMEVRSGPMIACFSASASIRDLGRFEFTSSAGCSSYRDEKPRVDHLRRARAAGADLARQHATALVRALDMIVIRLLALPAESPQAFPEPKRQATDKIR